MFRTSTFIPLMRVPHKRLDGYTETGVPSFVASPTIGISPIKFEHGIGSTSIRTDKSGSKSRAEEKTQTGRVLIEASANISNGDLITVYGLDWRIVSIYPRPDMDGQISHFQVDVESWV